MTSMVERMARAIARVEDCHRAWCKIPRFVQDIYLNAALAALREMREPTEVMTQAVLMSARDRAASEGATELRPGADYAKEYVGQSFSAAIEAELAAYEGKK